MPETKKMVNKKPVNTQAKRALQRVFASSSATARPASVRSRADLPSIVEVMNKARAFQTREFISRLDNRDDSSIFIGTERPAPAPMKIPIDDIPQSPKEISFSEPIEELNEIYAKGSARDFRFPPSLHVALAYYRSGREIFFHGRFDGSISASCSRCLKDFSLKMDRQFEFVLIPDPATPARGAEELSRGDLGLSFYSTEVIDLSPLIMEQVMLALPTRPLCAEDCRGLCSRCGADLNLGACGCLANVSDPRMAVFRTLKVDR
jgi:uncharacterized protein